MQAVNEIVSKYGTISLEQMSGIRLMNRIDTKFVTTTQLLPDLLRLAEKEYLVQELKGKHVLKYETTYFDTDKYDMFYTHQTGHANRQKLRFRTYVESDLQFMEVKTKNNHGRTKKKRIRVNGVHIASEEEKEFVKDNLRYDIEALHPVMRNAFDRITLVNKAHTERLTIDINLRGNNLMTGGTVNMEGLVIVELKRDGLCESPILEVLRSLRIFPCGFSKYCMLSAFTNEGLQINRFKPKMRHVERLLQWQ